MAFNGVLTSAALVFGLAVGAFSFYCAFSDQPTGWLLRIASLIAYVVMSLFTTTMAHEIGDGLREHDERVKAERATAERRTAA